VTALPSGLVNQYLKDAMGAEFTAKDFRTWGATLQAIAIMARTPLPDSMSEHALNACIVAAVKEVAAQLRNTPAVCRKSYINPAVFDGWRSGALHRIVPAEVALATGRGEQIALRFLRGLAHAPKQRLRSHAKKSVDLTEQRAVTEGAALARRGTGTQTRLQASP
jgi:DNA topoisomerase I